MRINWAEPAIRDLGSLRVYIARDNAQAAEGQVNGILASIGNLTALPGSGRPGSRPGTRELVISHTPYLAVYRVKDQDIQILRFLHGRQRWPDQIESS
jgi:toxin ParE1/3/4